MAATDEPKDGSYVLVKGLYELRAYQRDDQLAAQLAADQGSPDLSRRHWFHVKGVSWLNPMDPCEWDDLRQVGPVAYVGAFIDRSGKEA